MKQPVPIGINATKGRTIPSNAEKVTAGAFHCRVHRMQSLGESIVQVMLDIPAVFPEHRAGQYIELQLDSGLSRPFSIAGYTPSKRRMELHIERRQSSDATGSILRQMEESGEIAVKPARGEVRLQPATGPQIFLASGSGFAQIKALLEQSLRCSRSTERSLFPHYLFWGAERSGERYLEELIHQWCAQHGHLHYYPLDWQAGDSWEQAAVDQLSDFRDCQVYACGSPQRVYKALDTMENHGLCVSRFQSDVFAYAPRPLKVASA